MGSVSKDVFESSLSVTSQTRLIGWSQKAKDRELAVLSPTNMHLP